MDIFLTGATGYVGSAVLTHLLEAGHHVTALVRSDDKAAKVSAAGATALVGDLSDTSLLAEAAGAADGVIHLGSPGDASSAAVDEGVVEAFLSALKGTDKRYLHTSGVWTHGNGADITEATPFDPPAITGWRLPLDERVLAAAADGVHSVVIAPGIVYGHGAGLPTMLQNAPRDEAGALLYPGTGDQHWTTIHVDDLAALYVAALAKAPAGSYYLAVGGDNPTVRELALALSDLVRPEPVEDTQSRLGPLEEAFALDQSATGQKARDELGWKPAQPTLVAELKAGTYH